MARCSVLKARRSRLNSMKHLTSRVSLGMALVCVEAISRKRGPAIRVTAVRLTRHRLELTRTQGGSDLPETRANDPRDCGSSDEVTPRTDKDWRRRIGPDDLARCDRNPALSADRLHPARRYSSDGYGRTGSSLAVMRAAPSTPPLSRCWPVANSTGSSRSATCEICCACCPTGPCSECWSWPR